MAKREDVQARLEAIREASTVAWLQAGDAHRELMNLTDGLWVTLLGEEAPQTRFKSIAGKAVTQATTRQLPLVGRVEEAG